MYLLIRRISPYTDADVLLGVFATFAQATAASETYAARYTNDPNADPWRKQAYKEPGLSEQDLVIQELSLDAPAAVEVFIVSNYSEGFGQIVRHFDSLHVSADAAAARVAALNSIRETWPHYARRQQIQVGTLLSDSRQNEDD